MYRPAKVNGVPDAHSLSQLFCNSDHLSTNSMTDAFQVPLLCIRRLSNTNLGGQSIRNKLRNYFLTFDSKILSVPINFATKILLHMSTSILCCACLVTRGNTGKGSCLPALSSRESS